MSNAINVAYFEISALCKNIVALSIEYSEHNLPGDFGFGGCVYVYFYLGILGY